MSREIYVLVKRYYESLGAKSKDSAYSKIFESKYLASDVVFKDFFFDYTKPKKMGV